MSIGKEVFWLSEPHNLERARKKILQLKIAKDLGFRLPPTIITNNPSEVRDFLVRCGGRIILKTLTQGFVDYGHKQFNVPTTLITDRHLEQIELVKRLPSLFQAYIDKAYELRVTIVGRKVFSVRIDSSLYEETTVDWRDPRFIEKLPHTVVELPDEITDRCLLMMRRLGLEFGAFDFVVDKEGSYFFLEVNPNGQWYWLEYLTGVCISDAIADILISAPIQHGRR